MLALAWPWMLLSAPLPWIVYRFVRPAEARCNPLRVPFFREFSESVSELSLSSRLGNRLLLSCIWCCLILAAARPQWTGEPDRVPVSGRDMILAVDTSGSMKAEDMEISGGLVNRLAAVKHVARDFITRREGDRVGLILFGTHAYLQTPISLDLNTVEALLQESAIGIAGEKTAIGDAIGLAVKKLRQADTTPGNAVLILLTDGTNTAGNIDPLKAAELADVAQLKIYTIGIGSGYAGASTAFGQRVLAPPSDLDEGMLQDIARRTGGRYFRATDTATLEEIYELIDALEPISEDSLYLRPVTELFLWPLLLAMAAAACMALHHAVVMPNWPGTRGPSAPETRA